MNLSSGLFLDISGLIVVIVFFGLFFFTIFLDREDKRRIIRRIAAFVIQERAIKQAVEEGKGIHLALGWGELTDLQGGSGLIGLDLLKRISKISALGDNPPIATSGNGTLMILSQDILLESYRELGAESSYQIEYGQLTGLTPFSYAGGALPVIGDYDVSANFFFGHYGTEIALLGDLSEQKGSLAIGGSDEINAQAVLYASTEEPLIGEELYAVGAYMNPNLANLASIKVQDVMRWVIIGFIVLGVILKLVGVV